VLTARYVIEVARGGQLLNAPLFLGALGKDVRHCPRLRKLFLEGFAVAAGQRGRVMFGSHPAPEPGARLRAIALDVGAGQSRLLQPIAVIGCR
jgi:hypothetical protein